MSEFFTNVPGTDDLRLRVSVTVEEDNRFPTPLELPQWEEVEPVRAAEILEGLGLSVTLADDLDLAAIRWAPVTTEGGADGAHL
jgi:hypothetical protein